MDRTITHAVHRFNNNPGAPIINVAVANGFPPHTYAEALAPLFPFYQVVSVSLRPYWGTLKPESLTDWRQLADDMLMMLDELTDDPVVNVGHSVGGVATVHAALKRPEKFKKIILVDPTFMQPKLLYYVRIMRFLRQQGRYKLMQQALRRRNHWDSIDEAITYFTPKRLFKRWKPEMLRTYAEGGTEPDPQGGVRLSMHPEWEAQIFKTLPTDVWSLPKKLTVPALIIRGELTDVFLEQNAALFHRMNSRVKIITVPNAGHLVPQEQPDAVGAAIKEFLS